MNSSISEGGGKDGEREGEEKRERREGERQGGEVSNANNIHDFDPHK